MHRFRVGGVKNALPKPHSQGCALGFGVSARDDRCRLGACRVHRLYHVKTEQFSNGRLTPCHNPHGTGFIPGYAKLGLANLTIEFEHKTSNQNIAT